MRRVALLCLPVVAFLIRPAYAQLAQPNYQGIERFDPIAISAEVPDRDEGPDRIRTAIEVGLVLTFATVRYQFDGERKKNWDFPSAKERFNGAAWRYDNNPFGINNIWHAVEGTFFHASARSNNLSLPESFAVGFLASFAWEFGFEFNEKVSINDVWFTPATGVAIGEFVHWLGRYLDSAPANESIGHKVARWTLGFPYALHRRLDGRPPRSIALEEATDELGLRADIWHSFAVGATGASVSGDIEGPSALWSARAQARLAAVRGYRKPGSISLAFKNANFTEARYELTRGSDSNGSLFRAESVLVGLYNQEIDQHGTGQSWMLGAALAYDYRKEQLGSWRERNSLLHFPGLALDGEVLTQSTVFRTGVRVHGDFVSMEAPAHSLWREENPEVVQKTILRKQGYYFGWGGSVRLTAELEATSPLPLSIGGSILVGSYRSDEGLDRNQADIEADLEVETTLMDLDGHLRIGLGSRLPTLEFRASHQMRASSLENIETDRSITRLGVGLLHTF